MPYIKQSFEDSICSLELLSFIFHPPKQSTNNSFNDSFGISCSLVYSVGVTALLITGLNGHLIQLLLKLGKEKFFIVI